MTSLRFVCLSGDLVDYVDSIVYELFLASWSTWKYHYIAILFCNSYVIFFTIKNGYIKRNYAADYRYIGVLSNLCQYQSNLWSLIGYHS